MGQERQGGSRHRGPRIALCGSSDLDRFPESLVHFIADQPPNMVMLLRAPNKKDPGVFEQAMAKAALTMWLDVEWFRPDPENGRGGTFLRDVEMVRSADVVLAYFSSTTATGGTAHVVEKATDVETPVYAYGLSASGFVRIGEHDPHAAWASSVPK